MIKFHWVNWKKSIVCRNNLYHLPKGGKTQPEEFFRCAKFSFWPDHQMVKLLNYVTVIKDQKNSLWMATSGEQCALFKNIWLIYSM